MNEFNARAWLVRLAEEPQNPELLWQCEFEIRSNESLYSGSPIRHPEAVHSLLEILLRSAEVKHQHLALLVARFLRVHFLTDTFFSRRVSPRMLEDVSRDLLLLLLLRNTFNVDLGFEKFLRQLREYLLTLDQAGHLDFLIPLAAALAHQCINNEFIYGISPEEQVKLHSLQQKALAAVQHTGEPPGDFDLMLLAMYGQFDADLSEAMIKHETIQKIGAEAKSVIERLIIIPENERRLAERIESLLPIKNPTRQDVQNHYEENPFPRWFTLGGPQLSISQRLEVHGHKIDKNFEPGSGAFKILVAGCGTGQHPLSVMKANPKADVVAIDLSRASLAYAKRKADQFGIGNLRLIHGDLLDVSSLGIRFHHIDCIGVLHCLENPTIGWHALHRVLEPGGTLHVAVYGKLARMQISYLKERIRSEGITDSKEDMLKFRDRLINDDSLANFRRSVEVRDFFSVSMLRDLLFHQHEHQYSLKEISAIIEQLGLEFLGFDMGPQLQARYHEICPEDPQMNCFASWLAFEPHYAGSLEMFRLWLRKPRLCS